MKKVSNKGITYTDDFKRLFIRENESGKYPKEIFQECGFNIELLGMKRVQSSANRWRSAFRKNGVYQLQDTRKFNRGRPSKNKKIIKCEIHI